MKTLSLAKSERDSSSARELGFIPAFLKASGGRIFFKEFFSCLRRWLKAVRIIRKNFSSSSTFNLGLASVFRRIKQESTFGRGQNEVFLISKSISGRVWNCAKQLNAP